MAQIMIIDDSQTFCLELRQSLERNSHCVSEAKDGLQATEKLETLTGIQLFIVDYNMPEMDGLTLCSKIRQMEEYKETPIFMLTTETDPAVKQKGKSIGITAWVIKPFNSDKLNAAISKILSR